MTYKESAQVIGSRIRAAREAKGLSQERLATLVKTSRRNVLRWEGGYNTPRVEYIEAIARETDQTVDFFMASGEPDGDEQDEEAALAAQLLAVVRRVLEQEKRKLAPLALALGLVVPAAAAAQLAPRTAVVQDEGGLGECRQGEYQRVETVLGTYYCMGPPVGPWFWRFVPS